MAIYHKNKLIAGSGFGGGSDIQYLTEEEYAARKQAGTLNPDAYYSTPGQEDTSKYVAAPDWDNRLCIGTEFFKVNGVDVTLENSGNHYLTSFVGTEFDEYVVQQVGYIYTKYAVIPQDVSKNAGINCYLYVNDFQSVCHWHIGDSYSSDNPWNIGSECDTQHFMVSPGDRIRFAGQQCENVKFHSLHRTYFIPVKMIKI